MVRLARMAVRRIEGDRRADPDQPAIRRSGRHEPEQRAIERIDPGRGETDPAQAEREDRVLAVARVVVRRCRRRQDGEVGLAAEPVVERAEQVRDGLVRAPGVLQPARADLGVGTSVDPALGAVLVARRPCSRAGRRCG